MALAGDAINTQATQTRPRIQRPYLRLGQGVYQFLSVTEKTEKSYETRTLVDSDPDVVWVPKFSFKFAYVRPDKNEDKGHGRFFWIDVNRPKYLGRPKEGQKVSNAYLLLCRLLNDGADLTDAQLNDLVNIVNQLEVDQPQYYALLDGNGTKNWLDKVISRVPEDELLPKWVPAERAADPREATDNPLVLCSVTGEQINGWARNRGQADEEWVSNEKWATMQADKLGTAAVYVFSEFPGQFFAPPFGRKFYLQAKAQAEAAPKA
jgi:hypothetical protein